MVKNNKGYTMVIVLVVIVVLFSLSTALTILVNGEINQSSNNFKRIKAKYNAETGIEDSILKIKGGTIDEESDFGATEGWDEGDYSYTIFPPGDSGYSDYYKVDSTGSFRDTNKQITALINDGDPDKSFIYGNEFTINETTIGNVNIGDYFDTFSGYKKLDPEDITDLYKEAIIYFYDLNNNGEVYGEEVTDNDNDNVPDSYNGNLPKVIDSENVFDSDVLIEVNGTREIDFSEIFHYRGNLTYEGQNQGNTEINDEIVSNDVPPVIIVDGDLTFDSIRGINNVIFIVGGDVSVALRSAQMDMQNTFLYAQRDFGMAKDVGNPNQNPHIDFYGQIIVENNIDINIKTSNDAAYKKMLWPTGFDYSNIGDLYKSEFKIVQWNE